MALIKCPECGRDVSTEATACPGCGYPMKNNETAPSQAGPIRYEEKVVNVSGWSIFDIERKLRDYEAQGWKVLKTRERLLLSGAIHKVYKVVLIRPIKGK